jgi:hypothetical protein
LTNARQSQFAAITSVWSAPRADDRHGHRLTFRRSPKDIRINLTHRPQAKRYECTSRCTSTKMPPLLLHLLVHSYLRIVDAHAGRVGPGSVVGTSAPTNGAPDALVGGRLRDEGVPPPLPSEECANPATQNNKVHSFTLAPLARSGGARANHPRKTEQSVAEIPVDPQRRRPIGTGEEWIRNKPSDRFRTCLPTLAPLPLLFVGQYDHDAERTGTVYPFLAFLSFFT